MPASANSGIAADGRIVAVITNEGATQKTTWLHHDGQGSTMAVTDANGSVLERMAYEPFGKRRFVSNGADDPNHTIVPQNTNRGYTFHEHVDALRLVNMNGRFYDPMLARFISADPFIQEPFNPQNYNRYSYVINKPMTLTDPSGDKFWRSVLAIAVATYIGYGILNGCTLPRVQAERAWWPAMRAPMPSLAASLPGPSTRGACRVQSWAA